MPGEKLKKEDEQTAPSLTPVTRTISEDAAVDFDD